MQRGSLVTLFSFWEARQFFAGKDDRSPFCLLTAAGSGRAERRAEFAFELRVVEDLNDPERRFELTAQDIELLNPNTLTCPIFRTRRDAEITKGIYRRVPVLIREGDPDGNPWGIRFSTMFHMSNDSGLFRTRDELEADGWRLEGNVFVRDGKRKLPLYEAKMIHHFDHQWATYERDGTVRDVTPDEKADPNFHVMPRYWVTEAEVDRKVEPARWPLLSWRRNARSAEIRTFIATRLDKCAIGDSLFIAETQEPTGEQLAQFCCSFPFDFVARQKFGGSNMSFYLVEQFPVPMPKELASFLEDAGDDLYDMEACFFAIYGINRDDVDYILDTFPIVRRKDEAKFGEYRTKRLILEAYDRLAAVERETATA